MRINLGNLPVSKTAKIEKKSLIDRFLMFFAKEAVAQDVPEWTGVKVVHLGAFDINNKLLVKKRINVTQVNDGSTTITVEFNVPARDNVTIVVLGAEEIDEGQTGKPTYIAGFYGRNSEPIDLTAGATEEVEVYMEYLMDFLQYSDEFNFGYDTDDPNHNLSDGTAVIKWSRIYGVSNYILSQEYTGETGDPEYRIIDKISVEKYIFNDESVNDWRSYQIELEFSFAGINSEPVYFDLY